ncbi:MAG TPA: cupredoxin domain-containing protein [Gaiellaceae bacterium]
MAALLAAASTAIVIAALFGTSAASAASAAGCLHPKTTTVKVTEYEYGFKLSPLPVHCGTVTFVQKNIGSLAHNFDLQGVRAGKLLSPHQSAKFTVKLKAKTYTYQCDVLGHASLGMVGTLKVKD